jgi:hypothetical protein
MPASAAPKRTAKKLYANEAGMLWTVLEREYVDTVDMVGACS